jgi:secondary thiamine-phosphate synthase enzyme
MKIDAVIPSIGTSANPLLALAAMPAWRSTSTSRPRRVGGLERAEAGEGLFFGRIPAVKSFRRELWFTIPSRVGFVNITSQVEDCLRESGVREGLVLVNAMHITASVFVNDDERGLLGDFEVWLEKLAPHAPVSQYRHNSGEENADAHLKRSVMGREVVVAVTGGKLDFGPWEQIFYGEFDGRRKKRVLVKIVGE